MEYFVISDIHSFYDEMIECLNKKGYDKDNPNHILIVCGDIWDRGTQPLEVYNFLRSIPKERRVLIRGNHEFLLNDLVKRGFPESHDKHNGTYDTLLQISGEMSEIDFRRYMFEEYYSKAPKLDFIYDENHNIISYSEEYQKFSDKVDAEIAERNNRIFNNQKLKEILNWINSNEWVNYYETKDYIFVHSWIPVKKYIDWEKSLAAGYFIYSKDDEYRDDWQNATQDEWNDAMWGCPWKNAKARLNKTGKIIVCGHWHTSDFYNNLRNKNSIKKYGINNNPIYKSKKYKLIGLDACTAVTKKINVFTFEETSDFLK